MLGIIQPSISYTDEKPADVQADCPARSNWLPSQQIPHNKVQ
jgi:hypothetical protein